MTASSRPGHIFGVVLAPAAACLALSISAVTVDLAARTPAVMILGRSADFAAATSRSELLNVVQRVIEAQTTLDLILIEDAEVTACQRRRKEYDLLRCQLETGLLAATFPLPAVLLLVHAEGSGPSSRVHVGALNLGGFVSEPGKAPPVRQWVESGVKNIRYSPSAVVDGPGELEAALTAALRDELRAELGSYLRPEVDSGFELRVRPPDAYVELDGRALPLSDEGQVAVRGLSAGRHELAVARPGFLPLERELLVGSAMTDPLELSLSEDWTGEWTAVSWAAGVVTAAGIGMGVWAGLEADTRPVGPSTRGLIRFSTPSEVSFGEGRSVGEGPLIAGVAGGLVAGGLLVLIARAFLDEPSRSPWGEVLAGALVMGATYGAFEAAAALQ